MLSNVMKHCQRTCFKTFYKETINGCGRCEQALLMACQATCKPDPFDWLAASNSMNYAVAR